ncbi:hypothetical protein ST47_g7957 [Ascochyta rabiei]|uniref:Uncharacterized protein n=1 Tax=Didymella rabiei TaxID=5454 RepID=A0A163A1X3_DIDRA|nr:hypothetical protein ST47_g7957 [Ascochyta rabiei]
MNGEKKSTDLSSRLSVKRGGKLISKTLGKSSSAPSVSALPKAAVGASKVKKDEVQRRKNSFHKMLRASSKEKDSARPVPLIDPAPSASQTHDSHSNHVDSLAANAAVSAENGRISKLERTHGPGDVHLTELEKALAATQAETAALKQELERVKQDAQASVEISRYQAAEAHQNATREFAMTVENEAHEVDCKLQHQHHQCDEELMNQNHDLRYRLVEPQDQHMAQSARQLPTPMHNEENWEALTLRLHEAEKESHSRLQQLLLLKSSISSLTRTDSQVADSELAEAFAQLANRVREWVVSNYRRTKMNLVDAPSATTELLKSIKTDYEEIIATDKLALYQAIVSRFLMRIFDELVVFGMPGWGMYAGVRAFSAKIQNAGAEFCEWRRATLRVVEKYQLGPAFQEQKDEILQGLATELEAILLSITSTNLTPGARASLFGILNTAAELQRTLCLQKAQYRVHFFDNLEHERDHVENRTMEPVNDLEYSTDEGNGQHTAHRFGFCVFPCLKKLGHEVEADTELENIVFKARVCCGVG